MTVKIPNHTIGEKYEECLVHNPCCKKCEVCKRWIEYPYDTECVIEGIKTGV